MKLDVEKRDSLAPSSMCVGGKGNNRQMNCGTVTINKWRDGTLVGLASPKKININDNAAQNLLEVTI